MKTQRIHEYFIIPSVGLFINSRGSSKLICKLPIYLHLHCKETLPVCLPVCFTRSTLRFVYEKKLQTHQSQRSRLGGWGRMGVWSPGWAEEE